jgi:hypothetical protein
MVGVHIGLTTPVHAVRNREAVPRHLNDKVTDFPDWEGGREGEREGGKEGVNVERSLQEPASSIYTHSLREDGREGGREGWREGGRDLPILKLIAFPRKRIPDPMKAGLRPFTCIL